MSVLTTALAEPKVTQPAPAATQTLPERMLQLAKDPVVRPESTATGPVVQDLGKGSYTDLVVPMLQLERTTHREPRIARSKALEESGSNARSEHTLVTRRDQERNELDVLEREADVAPYRNNAKPRVPTDGSYPVFISHALSCVRYIRDRSTVLRQRVGGMCHRGSGAGECGKRSCAWVGSGNIVEVSAEGGSTDRPPPGFFHLAKVKTRRLLRIYESDRNPYKRNLGLFLLLAQYVLAVLAIVFENEGAVILTYGIVTAINGLLVATQTFYFEAQPVVLNESLFDVAFLIQLLFYSDDLTNDNTSRSLLAFALACASLSVVAFVLSYWLTLRNRRQNKLKKDLETRKNEMTVSDTAEPIFRFVAFVLTDTADFTILATLTVVVRVGLDTKMILFVIFLLLNPLISQLGTLAAFIIEQAQELSLPPKRDNESDAGYRKREDELRERISALKRAEASQERKNSALTGVLAMFVFPILYAIVLHVSGNTGERLILVFLPVFSAFPLWVLWQVFHFPWDSYRLLNDAWRRMVPRIVVVAWAFVLLLTAPTYEILLAATSLLYSLLPFIIVLVSSCIGSSRFECLYRELKVFDDCGTRHLFRSREEDRLKYLYDSSYPLCPKMNGLHDRSKQSETEESTLEQTAEQLQYLLRSEPASVLLVMTYILSRCYVRDLGGFRQRSEYTKIRSMVLALESEFGEIHLQNESNTYQRAKYLWLEAKRRLLGDDAVDLWSVIRQNPATRLSSIELHDTTEMTIDTATLDSVLQENRYLCALNFRRATFSPAAGGMLQRVTWYKSKSLKSLSLREVWLGDELCKAMLQRLPWQIETLNLQGTSMSEVDTEELGRFLQLSGCLLVKLHLSANRVGDRGAQFLGIALQKNYTLEELDLDWNLIGAAGAKHLAIALEANSTLLDLSLGGNTVGPTGARHLAEALTANTVLQAMSLRGNQIGNVGALGLAKALAKNQALQFLHLESNKIAEEGAKELGQAIEQNKSLRWLFLEDNEIGDEGAQALVDAMQKNEALHWLYLWNNIDIDEDMRHNLRRQDKRIQI